MRTYGKRKTNWRKVAGEALILIGIGVIWSMLFVYGLFTII